MDFNSGRNSIKSLKLNPERPSNLDILSPTGSKFSERRASIAAFARRASNALSPSRFGKNNIEKLSDFGAIHLDVYDEHCQGSVGQSTFSTLSGKKILMHFCNVFHD